MHRFATREGGMSRRAVLAALASIGSIVVSGCSIDFVALGETPIATLINVRSEHTDGLKVTVDVGHSGPVAAVVRIDGEPVALDGPDADGHYTMHFETSGDPLAPVVRIEVEQLPDTELAVQAPLLVRTGEATCEADGDVWLPAQLDSLTGDGFSRSWTMVLLDGEEEILAVAQTKGALPNPLFVPGSLVSESVRTAQVVVRIIGTVQEVTYDTDFELWTEAEWRIPAPCS